MKRNRIISVLMAWLLVLGIALSGCAAMQADPGPGLTLDQIPDFSGTPYVVINQNQPYFTQEDFTTSAYEYFSELDELNRCGYVMACIGVELMPTEPRGSIGQVKPSGWQTVKYDFVDGKYLYNRCHLIGFQLTGENANEKNLITGTRYMNTEGMLPFENMVADYVKETENHVLYRVTPIFHGQELVARGVQMEAWSVEDDGEGICFHVYVYNNQPGVSIDYGTGNSAEGNQAPAQPEQSAGETYILNVNSKKFHTQECGNGDEISPNNRQTYTGSRQNLIDNGFTPAGCCEP